MPMDTWSRSMEAAAPARQEWTTIHSSSPRAPIKHIKHINCNIITMRKKACCKMHANAPFLHDPNQLHTHACVLRFHYTSLELTTRSIHYYFFSFGSGILLSVHVHDQSLWHSLVWWCRTHATRRERILLSTNDACPPVDPSPSGTPERCV